MANEITISKGSYSVTVWAENVAESYANKLFLITPAQSSENQDGGSTDVKIVDLLRVTHDIVIKGFITGTTSKTAHDVKADLIAIFDGGGEKGGTTSLVYDTDTYGGYIGKLTFVEKSSDEPSDMVSAKENYSDVIKYEVAVTFHEGAQV